MRIQQSGFTLLELLIAMSLSVMVLAGLAFAVSVISQDWQRDSSRLEEQVDTALLLLQLERVLEGTFPHTYFDQDEKKEFIFFEGSDEELQFVSTVSPGRQAGLTAWSLEQGENDNGVLLKTLPAFAGNPTERLEEEEDASEALKEFEVRFEYLLIKERFGEQDPEWFDDWSIVEWDTDRAAKPRLPDAVRMILEHQDDSDRSVEVIAAIGAREPYQQ